VLYNIWSSILTSENREKFPRFDEGKVAVHCGRPLELNRAKLQTLKFARNFLYIKNLPLADAVPVSQMLNRPKSNGVH